MIEMRIDDNEDIGIEEDSSEETEIEEDEDID